MNVAHCIHGLGPGGAQKILASIVRGGRGGHLRYFVYSCHGGDQRREIENAGAVVRIVPRRFAKLDPTWIKGLARAMRRDAIDIVHTHLFGDSLHGYLAARRAGRLPVVMTLHTQPEGLSRLQRWGYRWLLRRCTRALACSEAVARTFAESGLVAGTLPTIPNGIEPPTTLELAADRRMLLRADLGVSPATVLCASIGRFTAAKGYSDLLDAFARLGSRELNARLLLIGDGPLRASLEEQARHLALGDRVIFAGFRSDVPELLQAVDVVVFSSRWEGLPVALLEAMAAGRCLVTTAVPGILEAVRADREALVAPIADPERLATHLARTASDADLRARLGEAAQRRFRERFTAAAMVASYSRVYREVAKTRTASSPTAARINR